MERVITNAILAIGMAVCCCSCVSSKKYDALEIEYNKLLKEHSELIDKYDSMSEVYCKMYEDYIGSKELRDVIENTKFEVKNLKRDISIYAKDNIVELDCDIYKIERALDGW